MAEPATSKTEGFTRTVTEELRRMASTETVVGKPITVDKRTMVPVIRITVGFGAGGGEGGGERPGAEKKEGHAEGAGMGGAGGVRVEPIAFIVLTDDKVSLLPLRGGSVASAERLIEAVPDLVDKIMQVRDKRTAEKKK